MQPMPVPSLDKCRGFNMKNKYHVCCSENINELEKNVNNYLNDGYSLYQGIIINNRWYLQVVVKLD